RRRRTGRRGRLPGGLHRRASRAGSRGGFNWKIGSSIPISIGSLPDYNQTSRSNSGKSGRGPFMFSQTVEYALRAVVHLAYEAPAARTTAQIADATQVPKDYLSKILQGLAKKGIVSTQRGVGGGVALAKTPEELTILDVVNAVEPIL